MTDTETKIRRRIGDDKYLFLMQVFHYFEDLLLKGMDCEDFAAVPLADGSVFSPSGSAAGAGTSSGGGGSSSFVRGGRGVVAAASAAPSGSFTAVQKQLAAVLQRLSNIEASVCKDGAGHTVV